jgi:hypothetical protein
MVFVTEMVRVYCLEWTNASSIYQNNFLTYNIELFFKYIYITFMLFKYEFF